MRARLQRVLEEIQWHRIGAATATIINSSTALQALLWLSHLNTLLTSNFDYLTRVLEFSCEVATLPEMHKPLLANTHTVAIPVLHLE